MLTKTTSEEAFGRKHQPENTKFTRSHQNLPEPIKAHTKTVATKVCVSNRLQNNLRKGFRIKTPTRNYQNPPRPTRSHQNPPGPTRTHYNPPKPTRTHHNLPEHTRTHHNLPISTRTHQNQPEATGNHKNPHKNLFRKGF
jgi:hypothetical protein